MSEEHYLNAARALVAILIENGVYLPDWKVEMVASGWIGPFGAGVNGCFADWDNKGCIRMFNFNISASANKWGPTLSLYPKLFLDLRAWRAIYGIAVA